MVPTVVARQAANQGCVRVRLSAIAQAEDGGIEHRLMAGAVQFAVIVLQTLGIEGGAGERFRVINIDEEDRAQLHRGCCTRGNTSAIGGGATWDERSRATSMVLTA